MSIKRKIFDLEASCSDDDDDVTMSYHSSDDDFIVPEGHVDYDSDVNHTQPSDLSVPVLKRSNKDNVATPFSTPQVLRPNYTPTPPSKVGPNWGSSIPPVVEYVRPPVKQGVINYRQTFDTLDKEPDPAPDTSSDSSQRVRRFSLTLNNYTDFDVKKFQTLKAKFKMFGKETGDSNTPHLQAYIEFDNKYTIKGVQKLFSSHWGEKSRWAVFVSKGSGPQNYEYCSKQGDFWEEGTRPKGQGKRSDLEQVGQKCIDGANVREIAMEHPKSFIQYSRGIIALHAMVNSTSRTEPTLGYWIWGATGTGKSRWAHSLSPESTYSKDPMTKYFCGYNQEDTVILDDYRPNAEMNFSFLLRLADRYPINIQTKFGNVQFNSKRLIVTSPMDIDGAFGHLDFLREGQLQQLKRRFMQLEFGSGKFTHLLRLTDINHPMTTDDEIIETYDALDNLATAAAINSAK